MAARRNPGYLLHIASTSCLVIVGAKLRKKIEVVLCKARGLGLPKIKREEKFIFYFHFFLPICIRILSTLELKALHSTERLTINTDQPYVFTFLPTVTQIFK